MKLVLLLSLQGILLAQNIVTFHDDGGWCWFEDERVIVSGGRLIIGSVASGRLEPVRKGAIEVTAYDVASGASTHSILHASPEAGWLDDHNSPALLALPDGRILAMYSRHGVDEKIYYRHSQPNDPSRWDDERLFVPGRLSKVTYSNLHYLPAERRIYNFFRGLHNSYKPSYAWSSDNGETWKTGDVFLNVPTMFRHRPYVKYASNGSHTVHIVYTEGHPRDFNNSLYHVYYRTGRIHRSDGKFLWLLGDGMKEPEEGQRIFQGDAANVAWVSDVHLDAQGHPFVAYSVRKDPAGTPSGQRGQDIRYRYARWDGAQWRDAEIAYAGSRLYAGEDDYTGNIALDPQDPDQIFISTNADPQTGAPLVSVTDGQRHWEIYRGRTTGRGKTWAWAAVTRHSSVDNIRPVVPIWKDSRIAVLWLRGKMRAYTDYSFEIVGFVEPRSTAPPVRAPVSPRPASRRGATK